MTLPSAYTEPTLAKYMARVLGYSVTETLAWYDVDAITDHTDDVTGEYVNLGEYEEPVNETLLILGETDISEYTTQAEIKSLRAVARWQVWKHARMALSDAYDESPGGGISMKRSQLFEMAKKNEAVEFMQVMSVVGSFGMTVSIVPVAAVEETDSEFG